MPSIKKFLEADYALYQYLVDILLPKVLKPIPNTLTQWIRTFSKNLENWMTLALQNVPEELKAIKVFNCFRYNLPNISLKSAKI